MDPKVSVQIIAKETTPLGKLFFECCLQSLHDSNWPDEIIIVDNDCSPEVSYMVRYDWAKKFDDKGVVLNWVPFNGNRDYSELRNFGMRHINPDMTVYHWIDTDEIYFPEHLDRLKVFLVEEVSSFKQAYTYFYHFIIEPKKWQDKCTKDNVFRYNSNLRWTKGVHEHVENLSPGLVLQTEVEYLHLGYLRPQWHTCLKWLHYDFIEHGHVNGYKDERFEDEDGKIYTKPWFRDWRNPNTILEDRLDECKEKGDWDLDRIPDAAKPIFDHADHWEEFLREIEDYTFFDHWKQHAEEVGSWRATLDEVVARMEACNWSYHGKSEPRAVSS